MRLLHKNVISEEYSLALLDSTNVGNVFLFADNFPPVVQQVYREIKKNVPEIRLNEPAYWQIEKTKLGHIVHNDKGDTEHMTWCTYGASCLLSPPEEYEGGEFFYVKPDAQVRAEEHYLSVVVHDSEQLHKVSSIKKGDRYVLLMFFS